MSDILSELLGAVAVLIPGFAAVAIGLRSVRKKIEEAVTPLLSEFERKLELRLKEFKQEVRSSQEDLLGRFEQRLSMHKRDEDLRFARQSDLERIDHTLKTHLGQYHIDVVNSTRDRARLESKVDELLSKSNGDNHGSV